MHRGWSGSDAIFNLGGSLYAIDDECTHMGGPLSEGTIEGDEIVCPWHGSHFNIKTGKVVRPPAGSNITSHNVRLSGERPVGDAGRGPRGADPEEGLDLGWRSLSRKL